MSDTMIRHIKICQPTARSGADEPGLIGAAP
jgi:hypothetical protein